MVGRLVEQQDIGSEQDGSGKGELHLPSTGERADGVLLLSLIETDRLKGRSDLLGSTEKSLVSKDPVDNGDLLLGTIDIVLNVESSDLLGRWETFDLVVHDGVHEGRFTGTVSTTETVSVSSLQSHVGVVEQDLGTVGQVELLNVTEILTLLLVVEFDLVALLLIGLLLEQLSDGRERVVRRKGELDVGWEGSLPGLLVKVVGVDERSGKDTSVGESRVGLLDGSTTVLLDEGDKVGGEVRTLLDLERGQVGTVGIGGDFTDSSQGGDGSVGDGSCFRVGNGLGGLDQSRQELGQERSDSVLRVDQLGHVVGNDADLSLGGGGSLIETSGQERSDKGDCRGSNFGNEGGG